MTEVEYRNSLYELSEIFKVLDKSLVDRIPIRLKDIIENQKSKNYNFRLDYSKKISEQKLSETTELFLTSLHLRYWCNEEEKKQILNTMRNNERKYQKELKEKYNPDIFTKNKFNQIDNNKINKQSEIEQIQLIEYKGKSWIKKWLQKLRSTLNNIINK